VVNFEDHCDIYGIYGWQKENKTKHIVLMYNIYQDMEKCSCGLRCLCIGSRHVIRVIIIITVDVLIIILLSYFIEFFCV